MLCIYDLFCKDIVFFSAKIEKIAYLCSRIKFKINSIFEIFLILTAYFFGLAYLFVFISTDDTVTHIKTRFNVDYYHI